MKIYILWNVGDDRPMINRDNFGNLLVYLTEEQAKARLMDQRYDIVDRPDQTPTYIIREAEVIFKQ